MKIAISLVWALAVTALVVPGTDLVATAQGGVDAAKLWRRKGGGGRGGGRAGGSSSSSGKGSSSKGRGSSSSNSKGSSSSGSSSSSSNRGGATTIGSGPRAQYGGGRFYGGGAAQPYRSGARSPRGIAPIFFGVAAGSLLFWSFPHGYYAYPYINPYTFYNRSSTQNETKAVTCGCDAQAECGCDENTDFLNEVIGNGSYSALNRTLVDVGDVNGTSTIVLNGTLPNGTTAAGGTEDANASDGMRALLQNVGWWPMVAASCAVAFWG